MTKGGGRRPAVTQPQARPGFQTGKWTPLFLLMLMILGGIAALPEDYDQDQEQEQERGQADAPFTLEMTMLGYRFDDAESAISVA